MSQPTASQNAEYTSGQRHTTLVLYLCALVVASIFFILLKIQQAAPAPFIDEGGYINMLDDFYRTGKMNLMCWSQPTLLGVTPVAYPLHSLGLDPHYSLAGLLASMVVVFSILIFTSKKVGSLDASLLTLLPFCFRDFSETAVTVMSDQFFLAYFALALIALNRSLTNATYLNLLSLGTFFVLACLTRMNGLILPMALLIATKLKPSETEKKSLLVLLCSTPLIFIASTLATTHRIPALQITALPQILHGQLALFDVRATVKASFDVALACVPILVLLLDIKKINKWDIATGFIALAFCANFFLKGQNITCLYYQHNLIALWMVPLGCLAMSSVFRNGPLSNKMFQVCLLCALGTIAVMPIMPHPLSRHALPAVISLSIGFSFYKLERPSKIRYAIAFSFLAIFISLNVLTNFNLRKENQIDWNLGESALAQGIPVSKLFVGWSWFCFHDLNPVTYTDSDFQHLYKERKDSATFIVKDGAVERKNQQ